MTEETKLKWYRVSIILIAFIFAVPTFMHYTVDDTFMYLHFKDILAGNLFRKTDFLTLHENLPFLHQKWAMCGLTYILYEWFGFLGWHIGSFVFNLLSYFVLAKIIYKLNPKFLFANIYIFIVALTNNYGDSPLRPQLFSIMFIMIEIYCLELFTEGKLKRTNLWIILFFISIGTMWFHSTMWPLCVITIMPYLVPVFGKWFKKPDHSIKDVWIGFLILFAASLLQPNGLSQYKYMYICCTYRSSAYKGILTELKHFTFTDSKSLLFLLPLFMFLLIYVSCTKHKEKKLWHILLAGGYVVVAMDSIRMVSYASVVMAIVSASVIRDSEESSVRFVFSNFDILATKKKIVSFCAILSIVLISVIVSAIPLLKIYNFEYNRQSASLYFFNTGWPEGFDVADLKDKRVWTDFQYSTWLEYDGAIPYIDARAELYDANSGEKDIYNEWYHTLRTVATGSVEETAKEFRYLQDKYDFDYYIIPKYWVDRLDFDIEILDDFADEVASSDIIIVYKVRKNE